jgi:chemotaxis protein MotB
MRQTGLLSALLGIVAASGCVSNSTHEETQAELTKARSAAIKVAKSFADYKKEATEEAEKLKRQVAASAAEVEAVRREQSKAAADLDAAKAEAGQIKRDSSSQLEELRREHAKVVSELRQAREEGVRVSSELETTRSRLIAAEQSPAAHVNVAMTVATPPELTEKLKRLEDEAASGLEERKRLEQKALDLEQQLHVAHNTAAEAVTTTKRQAEALRISIVDRLLFDSGEADMKVGGCQELKQFSEALRRATDKQIRVEGHTDSKPPKMKLRSRYPTNWELSTARAINVVQCLIKQGGLEPGRLSAVGYGDSRPVAGNETEDGRRRNRRVEIVLYPSVPMEDMK